MGKFKYDGNESIGLRLTQIREELKHLKHVRVEKFLKTGDVTLKSRTEDEKALSKEAKKLRNVLYYRTPQITKTEPSTELKKLNRGIR